MNNKEERKSDASSEDAESHKDTREILIIISDPFYYSLKTL